MEWENESTPNSSLEECAEEWMEPASWKNMNKEEEAQMEWWNHWLEPALWKELERKENARRKKMEWETALQLMELQDVKRRNTQMKALSYWTQATWCEICLINGTFKF
jgi:hypothetical protein